jgi:hypothetical protein
VGHVYQEPGGSALDGVGDQKCKVLEYEATIIQGMLQLLALRTIFERSARVRNVSYRKVSSAGEYGH